ncbi:plasmid stabilization system protein ParE [Rhizobium leguminosarum]|nr:plasmid stabilization system protein ParE [Rhizobium leguminosarum]
MAPRVLILPAALDNYRLAVRETARKWSPEQAKAYGRLLRAGFEGIPEAYARVRTKSDERVGNSLFRLHKVEHHYAVYIVADDATFVIAAVLHERMDIPAQLRAVERLTDREYETLMGHPRSKSRTVDHEQPTGHNSLACAASSLVCLRTSKAALARHPRRRCRPV